jgi:fructose-bisphosphate aldolase class I
MTTGLESLAERLAGYAAGGACFAKWRAVIRIAAHLPTAGALNANARALACYAAACQEHGLVPIVEPEVLATGDHRIDRCAAATTRTLDVVFAALGAAGVRFPSMLLKPNMVTAGLDCPDQPSDEEVAEATLHTLRATVPDELGGVAFLSGGARPEVATARLAAICAAGPTPWPVTFSFGRALVDPALRAWADDPARTSSGQLALASRAAANAAARSGQPAPI